MVRCLLANVYGKNYQNEHRVFFHKDTSRKFFAVSWKEKTCKIGRALPVTNFRGGSDV